MNPNDFRRVGYVWETDNYDQFKRLEQNRAVTKARKERIAASMSVHEVLCPIIVNKSMEIIDGQGRFEAKKEMGLPIYFIVDENADITDCRRMNATNASWSLNDFVASYAEGGNENYINLIKAHKATGMTIQRLVTVKGLAGRGRTELISSGNLIYTKEDIEKAKEFVKKTKEILEALCFTQSANDAFFSAVRVLFNHNLYSHSKMLRQCRKCRTSYCQMSKLEDQLKEFSRIYNRGSRSSAIYFEDYMRNRGHNVRSYDDMSHPIGKEEDVSTLKTIKEENR